ncbi:hypothetical protein EZL74_03580 [Flavobacterium silvisoli]|uniref:Uncharacterized protein n=1 Tax=Flavobacterium silvisoli TaxID=2529433 RepID=A0A4Q9Z9B2_9FLAO|nr:hypothetical protein [Flavobacterium silvisoli]TBX70767.1 hypothetical protein EZL74_03580 [Flavobacterium silvisoli]
MEEKTTSYREIGPLNQFTVTINEKDEPPTAFITVKKNGNKGEARFQTTLDDLTQMAKVANMAKAKFKSIRKKQEAQKTKSETESFEVFEIQETVLPPIDEKDLKKIITEYFKDVQIEQLAQRYAYSEEQIRYHIEKKGIVLFD